LNALSHVLGALPAGFPTPIVVVHHLDPRHRGLIAEILSRRTKLQVQEAREGDHLRAHTVFVAPPDYHLLVNSVAASFKGRAITVILSGTGADGAMGLRAIKKMRGTVVAQDEATNEELQSTNEELHTINGELRERSGDLNSVNAFLVSVLSGIRDGLIVVDRAGQITAWNPAAEELWGLHAAEVLYEPFFGLDIGLPVDLLGAAVRGGLNGESGSATLEVVNRRGRACPAPWSSPRSSRPPTRSKAPCC
jgi:two-component system chemotaxis response regulator CheB